jgi:hypothetical protein
MKKVKNHFMKYSTISFDRDDIEAGLFFISTSVAVGAFLGGQKYCAQFAAAAGVASSLDVALKYFDLTDSYYITAAMLSAIDSYQDHSHTRYQSYDRLNSKVKDSSSVDSSFISNLIENIFSQWGLVKQLSKGAATGILGASAFSWALNSVSNKSDNKALPYAEHHKNLIDEEDTAYTHEDISYNEL